MNEKCSGSKLMQTAMTGNTDVWNDSCSQEEMLYALENGAVGATTNPVIVGEVLKKEMFLWKDRILELIKAIPEGSEEDIAWKLNEEMALKGANLLKPVFDRENKMKGRISIQTNAKYYRNPDLLLKQSLHFNDLTPNIQVKIPVTKAGVKAIEEATFNGVNINATVCFTVSQALAVAEAVERGLKRRSQQDLDTSEMTPVCTIMVGRVDDWIKVVANRTNSPINPDYLEWCGIAVMKNAYNIFKQRGYKTRLLAAAYRNLMHWSEFVGADMVLTIPHSWQKKINESNVEVETLIDRPVDSSILDKLLSEFDEFRKAYNHDGLTDDEFESYGATRRTLRAFLEGYEELLSMIRDLMLPNPDRG